MSNTLHVEQQYNGKKKNWTDVIMEYYEFRGFIAAGGFPDQQEALNFVFEELGELAGAFNNESPKHWTRNNPGKKRSVEDEVGDVMMMLGVFCMNRKINPLTCMVSKFESKGYDPQCDVIEMKCV